MFLFCFDKVDKTMKTPSKVSKTFLNIPVFVKRVRRANLSRILARRQHSRGSGVSVLWAASYVSGLKLSKRRKKSSKCYNCVHFLFICFLKIFFIHSFFSLFVINNKHGEVSFYNTFYGVHTSLTKYFLWRLLSDFCDQVNALYFNS